MGRKGSVWVAATTAVLVLGMLLPGAASASQGSEWTSAGGNRQNTRFQASEHTLSVDNVVDLAPTWVLSTGGDVSATPAVDSDTVYFPDWAGNLYAVDKLTGLPRWVSSIAATTGVAGDISRTTPAVTEDKLIVGTQSGRVLAIDKQIGQLIWATAADTHSAAVITQSPTVFDGRVYVGVASREELLSAVVPGYECCSFRGSMLAIDLDAGAILWKTYMAPDGYSGSGVWGSSPAIDTRRGQVYVATGNNYSVPDDVLDCVAAAGGDPDATAACLPADDLFDSIVAIDMMTGAVRWATRTLPYDAWTADCIPFLGDGSNCPEPPGPGYGFGQAPALFNVKTRGKPIELVGAGQQSGQNWTLDPDTGAVGWITQAGPGGTAGGLQWGSAVDDRQVYTANANSDEVTWTLPGGSTTTDGIWSALDATTGEILWQTSPSHGGSTSGPVTTANGVVFGCSLDAEGHMYALSAATGVELWSFPSGGSCLSGAAISDGMVFWGSGYSNLGLGTANNQLYAFGIGN
ncbi:MAG: PQQ-binding-like beta-propeller repeat protein [Acidimicrobiia bacterium]